MIAAFIVPYGPAAKSISRPETLEIVTIEPAPLASKCGSAASTSPTAPIRSTLKLVCQFSVLSVVARALTLETKPSMPPSAVKLPFTQSARAAASPTSTALPIAMVPSAVSADWVSATASGVRAQYATDAPSANSPSTTARPMPRVPPVTRNRFPDNPRSMIFPPFSSVGDGSQRSCRTAQLAVNPAVGRCGRQQPLVDLGDGTVVGVDDVGDRHLRYLRQQLVGVESVQPVQLTHPGDHVDLTGPPCLFQRPARTDAHQMRIGLEPRPGWATALDQVHDRGDVHRAFDCGATGFAFALAVVTISEGEQRTGDIDPQVAGRANGHLWGVHVSAECLGHQGAAYLAPCWGDPDRTEHRVDGQVHGEVAALRREPQRACGGIVFVYVGPLRQRRLQRGTGGNAGQPAEERDQRRRTPGACRSQIGQVDRQRVARLGALDPERPGLRVQVLGVERSGGHVVAAGDASAVGVLGP